MDKTPETEISALIPEQLAGQRVETTLGDLISAIADAASEAHVDSGELARITKVVLDDLLKRRKS